MLNSYIGNNIVNQPAYLRRNEKFHKEMHNDRVPTIEELKIFLDKWFEYRNTQECPNVKGKTVGEVFNSAKGDGVDINMLDDLMMATEIRQVQRNGVSLFGNWYYSPELYGQHKKVQVKYSFSDISYVRIYSLKGEFICEAHTDLKLNPHADIFGDAKDMYSVRKALQLQKKQLESTKRKALKIAPKSLDLLGVAEYRQIECRGINKEVNKGVKSEAEEINPITYLNSYSEIEQEEKKVCSPLDNY
jgi:putative transposase